MKTSSLMRRLIAAIMLFAFVASVALGGAARAASSTPGAQTPAAANPCATSTLATPAAGSPTAGAAASQDFDLLFMDMMIPHHKSAVAMAQVALVRGEHQEIRDLAQQIISSQQAEIAQMQAWRDAWYPGTPTMSTEQMNQRMGVLMGTSTAEAGQSGAMAQMMNPAAEQQALCRASGPFDQAFLQLMIPHHKSAVAMARVALQQATHPEIKTLAQAIIASQQQEIAQMQGWLMTWYSATPTSA